LDKSNDINEIQPSKMQFIYITFSVLNFDKSNDINEQQPSNIQFISYTFWVLKFDKSNDIKKTFIVHKISRFK